MIECFKAEDISSGTGVLMFDMIDCQCVSTAISVWSSS